MLCLKTQKYGALVQKWLEPPNPWVRLVHLTHQTFILNVPLANRKKKSIYSMLCLKTQKYGGLVQNGSNLQIRVWDSCALSSRRLGYLT